MVKRENLKVFNTLKGQKEPFVTAEDNKVGMYVCGPTTYNYIHLGNARPLVVFDTVRRYLEYLGYQVTYIQNFTDVDDKIIKRARGEGEKPLDLASKYVQEYFRDADALNVKRATVHPKVSRHMPEIVDFVQGLLERGFAYEIMGDVYFDVGKFTEYGKLSGRSLDDLQAGARVEVDERKRHPADFALWKKAKEGEPSWASPWGQGRPGWHIECSAMSHKYLGANFEIHAGGYDLIFPHHENEIAQSEALFGEPMARYWLHNGFITVNEEKMSKSLGNFFLLRDILAKYPPQVVRFYLLATHYRSPLDFDDEKLTAAAKGLERLENSWRLLQEALARGVAENAKKERDTKIKEEALVLKERFLTAMDDDFNTALAIAVLFDFARTLNSYISQGIGDTEELEALKESGELYIQLLGILGLKFDIANKADDELGMRVEELIAKRQAARAQKDYRTSDAIRDELNAMGIVLEDTPQGVRWRQK